MLVSEQLNNLVYELVGNLTEKIIKEAVEDGIDPHKNTDKMIAMIDKAAKKAGLFLSP
jgi:hypothetical protein